MNGKALPIEARQALWRQIVAELLRPNNDQKKAAEDQSAAQGGRCDGADVDSLPR